MKKLLSLVFAISVINNMWASGIGADATSATCDNDTLETYSDTANLEINWIPNYIDIKWYNGDTQLSAPSTCTYGGDLILPSTQPTKTGYTFKGWELHNTSSLTCGMEQLDTNIQGTDVAYKTITRNKNNSKYGITTNNTWATEFNYGVVYGSAMCSVTLYITPKIYTPSTNSGRGCWCRAIGFTATDTDYSSGPKCILSPLSNLWVAVDIFPTDEECVEQCAANCSIRFRVGHTEINTDTFRPAVFSIIGQ